MLSIRTIAVSVLLMLHGAGETLACTCALPHGTVPSQVARAKTSAVAVFSGKVTKTIWADCGRRLIVSITVDKIWKGEVNREITIYTAGSGASCGFAFRRGTSYLVYCYRGDDGELWTNLCTRTASLAAAAPDRRYLGRFTKPLSASIRFRA